MSVNRAARGSPNAAGPTRLDRPRAREWVTDLRDLLGPDGDVAETKKGSGRFVTTVVEAATARPPGAWATTVVRCTLRRPARARCDGLVQVRSGESDTINWRCVACGNHGSVQGWRRSPFDLSRARDSRSRSGRQVLRLPSPEYRAIVDGLIIGADCPEILAAAAPDGDQVVLHATADEIDSLSGAVAAEANHASSRRMQRLLDSAFDRLRTALDPPKAQALVEAPRFATSPISPEEIAGQIAAILGVPAEAASRYQDIFVATAHVGLAARALEDRIRTIARRGSGKPPLILALELGEALDQTATFARCHPREGFHVLVAFIQALRGVEPAPEIIPLVSEAAAALVSSAKRATDPRVMSQALCALVEAYVGDDRFGEIASILEHARLGKRATKSALTELVRIETAAAGDIRARADRLKRTILGSHLS
jgi:hypothetical protein